MIGGEHSKWTLCVAQGEWAILAAVTAMKTDGDAASRILGADAEIEYWTQVDLGG